MIDDEVLEHEDNIRHEICLLSELVVQQIYLIPFDKSDKKNDSDSEVRVIIPYFLSKLLLRPSVTLWAMSLFQRTKYTVAVMGVNLDATQLCLTTYTRVMQMLLTLTQLFNCQTWGRRKKPKKQNSVKSCFKGLALWFLEQRSNLNMHNKFTQHFSAV